MTIRTRIEQRLGLDYGADASVDVGGPTLSAHEELAALSEDADAAWQAKLERLGALEDLESPTVTMECDAGICEAA